MISFRLSAILLYSPGICSANDLLRCPSVRNTYTAGLHLDLLPSRINVCHGHKRFRRSTQAHPRWEQPTHTSKYICFWHSRRRMYLGADELFQQSIGHLFNKCVRPHHLHQTYASPVYAASIRHTLSPFPLV